MARWFDYSITRLNMKLKGKAALITGVDSRIGLATGRVFIAEGARVAKTGRNKTILDAANWLAIVAGLNRR
jgi:NAD(P)-dependent dehydrogenase (short-subunit alcohol dehydrogenase family)